MAVREYQDKPIPGEVLRRIVEAGRLSASASNGQPWHFIVVRDRANLRKLGSLIRTGPYVANAPAAMYFVISVFPISMTSGVVLAASVASNFCR